MAITIPFGKSGMVLHDALAGAEILESRVGELKAEGCEDALVQAAMEHPIGTPTLRQLAQGKQTCTIIVSDHTRPVPSRHILPFMLQQLREGNPEIEVTLLVATGFHRPSTEQELRMLHYDRLYGENYGKEGG